VPGTLQGCPARWGTLPDALPPRPDDGRRMAGVRAGGRAFRNPATPSRPSGPDPGL